VLHFASKDALDIEGIGDVIARHMVESGRIRTLADIVNPATWTESDDALNGKTLVNIQQQIKESSTPSMARFLTAIGIPGIGVTTAASIARAIPTPQELLCSSYEDFIAIPGVGKGLALTLASALSEGSETAILIESCIANGLKVLAEVNTYPLKGEIWAVTGSLKEKSRRDFERDLRQWGATVSWSKRTQFLVVGDNPTLRKVAAAENYGTTVFTEEAAYQYLKAKLGEPL
jgi:DNA ligase (NAD+)